MCAYPLNPAKQEEKEQCCSHVASRHDWRGTEDHVTSGMELKKPKKHLTVWKNAKFDQERKKTRYTVYHALIKVQICAEIT